MNLNKQCRFNTSKEVCVDLRPRLADSHPFRCEVIASQMVKLNNQTISFICDDSLLHKLMCFNMLIRGCVGVYTCMYVYAYMSCVSCMYVCIHVCMQNMYVCKTCMCVYHRLLPQGNVLVAVPPVHDRDLAAIGQA